jgi:putative SOS response-associated peptidase YedK
MCGRFTLRAPASVVAEQFALFDVEPFAPRFNIAPSQSVAVVRCVAEPAGVRRELALLRWGLVPSWADDPAIGNRLINARSETAAEKPAFRAAFRRRRCLVVADGFYEWQKVNSHKQPYFIRFRDDRPFAIAGLWESWEGVDHSAVESCVLLTTGPNELMRPIHDRMPVILPRETHDLWLDPGVEDSPRLVPLLVPYPAEPMAAYPIGTLVNNPRHDDPRCIEQIEGRRELF